MKNKKRVKNEKTWDIVEDLKQKDVFAINFYT